MKVDYINPIYQAANQVFKNMFQLELEKGDLKLEEDIVTTKEANVSISITGELSGTILFSFPKEMALKMVEDMSGMETKEFDKFVASAIGELGNIISGNAISNLSDHNFDCDIAPPQISLGKNKTLSTATEKTLVIPLHSHYGEFELNVSINEKNSK
ncbi:MAG: chemotaxis protein CheX [Halanaerobiales bacterium]